jgi:hypothetical protein
MLSLLSFKKARKKGTTSHCKDCVGPGGHQIYLCLTVRTVEEGNTLTCFDIWHKLWENGTKLSLNNHIRFRNPNMNKLNK